MLIVAFSPDGRRLVSAGSYGKVNVWDATAPTPERRIEYEARGLVEWLFAKQLTPEGVASAVLKDVTITEPVRKQALAWVPPCARIQAHPEAARLVTTLFAKGLLRSEVCAALDRDAGLSAAVRKEARRLAETLLENAAALNEASWDVVRKSDVGAAACELALRRAEAACRLDRNDLNLNTLGVAQYRAGQYRMACQRSWRSRSSRERPCTVTQPILPSSRWRNTTWVRRTKPRRPWSVCARPCSNANGRSMSMPKTSCARPRSC
jgi:hypothetical protein